MPVNKSFEWHTDGSAELPTLLLLPWSLLRLDVQKSLDASLSQRLHPLASPAPSLQPSCLGARGRNGSKYRQFTFYT